MRQTPQGLTPGRGHGEIFRSRLDYSLRPGEEMGEFFRSRLDYSLRPGEEMGEFVVPNERLGEWFSAAGDEAASQGAGTGHGDLLAQHRTNGELDPIHASGDAPSGRTPHEIAEDAIVSEHVGDGDRVGVEIEEAAAALHRGTEVPQVLEPEYATHVLAAVGEGHCPGAVRQTQCPPVGLPIKSFDAGYRSP